MKTTKRIGSEGPKHDPYGYDEYVVKLEDREVVLHLGLLNCIKVNKKIILSENSKEISVEFLTDLFEELVGMKISEIEEEYNKQFTICSKCGSDDLKEEEGHPGETFYICQKCKNINVCIFDRSAIE